MNADLWEDFCRFCTEELEVGIFEKIEQLMQICLDPVDVNELDISEDDLQPDEEAEKIAPKVTRPEVGTKPE